MEHMLNLPKKVYFKTGCTPVALRELSEVYHCARALLVTEGKLYRDGVASTVVDLLRRAGIRVAEYFTIGEQVCFEDLRNAEAKLHEFQPDVIIGVGGNNAMSAAKALLAMYEQPGLDWKAAAADPSLISAPSKAMLVLIASNFASGAQTSPFAVLKDDEGNFCILKSLHLLPEISVTDADYAATLTAEQIRACALEALSYAARAYMEPNCSEFTAGLLTDAIAQILKYTGEGMAHRPAAMEHLCNAASLMGAACGGVVDVLTPDLPCFPTEKERAVGDNDVRCAALAEQLGFADCRALFDACEALRAK